MMTTESASSRASASAEIGQLPVWTVAALQDDLLTASNDLDRLQGLLTHACDTLIERFSGASGHINDLLSAEQLEAAQSERLNGAIHQLGGAMTALQFQDMASQLIHHTHTRLRGCADQLAVRAFGADEGDEAMVMAAPMRPNPVTQSEMDAGSVELF
jgi:hypothetical protein